MEEPSGGGHSEEEGLTDMRLPPPVASVVAWWTPEIRACLGGKLLSIVLHGSVALGDFCGRWSDVDVCVVLKTPITPEEGEAVGDIHDRMGDRFIAGTDPSWQSGQAIEGSYVPIELVSDEAVEAPCYTAGGSSCKWAVGHPISPFDRYMLAHFARPLAGDPLSFSEPQKSRLVSQTERDLIELRGWDRKEHSAIWLAGMFHWAARSLVFWRDGKMVSKSAALEQEIAQGSPFAAAFELALRIRRDGSETAADHRSELMKQYGRLGNDLAGEIERNLGRPGSGPHHR